MKSSRVVRLRCLRQSDNRHRDARLSGELIRPRARSTLLVRADAGVRAPLAACLGALCIYVDSHGSEGDGELQLQRCLVRCSHLQHSVWIALCCLHVCDHLCYTQLPADRSNGPGIADKTAI